MSRPTEHDRRMPDYRTYLTAYERAWQQWQQDPSPHNRALLHTGEQILYRELAKPGRFDLGAAVATPGAIEAMEAAGHIPPEFLLRHVNGEWLRCVTR